MPSDGSIVGFIGGRLPWPPDREPVDCGGCGRPVWHVFVIEDKALCMTCVAIYLDTIAAD